MRPRKCRRICFYPKASFFKPAGIPMRNLSQVVLNPDEIEVIKLLDVDNLDQAGVAKRLGVSRITVQRIYKSARKKVAIALTEGRALRFNNEICGCGCRMCQRKFSRGGE